MERKARKDFLIRIELFKPLIDEELNLVSELFEIQSCKRGNYLFKENTHRQSLFLIFEKGGSNEENFPQHFTFFIRTHYKC